MVNYEEKFGILKKEKQLALEHTDDTEILQSYIHPLVFSGRQEIFLMVREDAGQQRQK